MANFTPLFAAKMALDSHLEALQRAGNDPAQGTIDVLTASVLNVDNQAVAVLVAPPTPPPTGELDFSAFDDAVARFRADGRLTQNDIASVTRVLTVNTL